MKLIGRLLKKNNRYQLQYWGYDDNLSNVVETQTSYKFFGTEEEAQEFIQKKNIVLENDYTK